MPSSRLFLALLLVSAWVLGLGGISFYTPAMLNIQQDFGTTSTLVKLTISFFIFGKAISMILIAPFADCFSRKKLFLFGLSLFTLGSIVCLVSPNITLLLIGRFIEGLGVSICILMGRALVNDQYPPNEAANLFSIIFIGNALAITLLPIFAGYITVYLHWRFIFIILSIYGCFVTTLIYYFLPQKDQLILPLKHWRNFGRQSIHILLHPRFIAFMLSLSVIDAGEKILTTIAPFFFMEKLGISHISFGYVQGALWGAHLLGLALCSVLVLRQKLDNMIVIGSLICMLATIVMSVSVFYSHSSFIFLITGMFIFMLSTGFIVPTSLVGIAHPFPKMIALATALAMSIEFFLGSALTALVSHFNKYDIPIVIITPFFIGFIIFICWYFLLKNSSVKSIPAHHQR